MSSLDANWHIFCCQNEFLLLFWQPQREEALLFLGEFTLALPCGLGNKYTAARDVFFPHSSGDDNSVESAVTDWIICWGLSYTAGVRLAAQMHTNAAIIHHNVWVRRAIICRLLRN